MLKRIYKGFRATDSPLQATFISAGPNTAAITTAYTHKNEGPSRCHREPLTSEEPFCFTISGSSDNKKVRKKWFFKETLTECFSVEPKMVLLWHHLKNLLKHLYF